MLNNIIITIIVNKPIKNGISTFFKHVGQRILPPNEKKSLSDNLVPHISHSYSFPLDMFKSSFFLLFIYLAPYSRTLDSHRLLYINYSVYCIEFLS